MNCISTTELWLTTLPRKHLTGPSSYVPFLRSHYLLEYRMLSSDVVMISLKFFQTVKVKQFYRI